MSWAAVVVCGGVGFVEPPGTTAVAAVGCDDPVEFGDAVASLGSLHAVIAVPSGLEERSHSALALTAFRWPELRIARLTSPHVPMALHAALVVARSTVADPGLAPAFVETFAAHTWSGLWTSSVAHLLSPAPSGPQYLRSFLPGSSFLVGCHPEPWIGGPERIPGSMTPGLSRTLLTGGPTLPASLAAKLMAVTGASGARPYPVAGDWSDLYGRGRTTQLALVPNDAAVGRVGVFGGCTSCGNLVGTPVCPYCRIHVRPLATIADRQPARPSGGPA